MFLFHFATTGHRNCIHSSTQHNLGSTQMTLIERFFFLPISNKQHVPIQNYNLLSTSKTKFYKTNDDLISILYSRFWEIHLVIQIMTLTIFINHSIACPTLRGTLSEIGILNLCPLTMIITSCLNISLKYYSGALPPSV